MTFLLIAYCAVGLFIAYLSWGLATLDSRLRDVSYMGILCSLIIGILWLPALFVALIYLAWQCRK